MKEILYKKMVNLEERTKAFSVKTTKEEKSSKVTVEKNFSYKILPAEQLEQNIEPPQIHIRKGIDNKTKTETFQMDVEGYFYMTKDRALYKICFQHKLNIQIVWKDKILSPKKSEVLTK
jgi:hypothetical protein